MEDGGDLDFSGDLPAGCSMDSFFDEILKDDGAACTHTHACNPPVGPDPSQHTHTCFHVHTKILPSSATDDDTADSNYGADGKNHHPSSKKRPFGNREAVRKYREKKKARAASLADEVLQLRSLNQQLMRRLQSQAALEAEVARLRCLLVDIRGRIEGEIGSFPYRKPPAPTGNMVLDSCENLRCGGSGGPVYCVGPGGMGEIGIGNGQGCGGGGCEIGIVQCAGSSGTGSKEFYVCGGNADVGNIKGVHAAPEG